MIPDFGGVTRLLPTGVHAATWAEVAQKLGFSERRRELLEGLLAACRQLKNAGAKTVYIDGSFATKKHVPSDWDACFDSSNVDPNKMDPVLLDMTNERAAMKAKYLGEMFQAHHAATVWGEPFFSFFQKTKDGKPKGIIALDLGSLP